GGEDGRRRHGRVVAGQARRERVEPELAAHLAVGDHVDIAFFLQANRLEHGAVLDAAQVLVAELPGVVLLDIFLQVLGPQQAADDLAAIARGNWSAHGESSLLAPQLLGRQPRALGQRLELGPDYRRVAHALAQPAVGARDNVLTAHELREL